MPAGSARAFAEAAAALHEMHRMIVDDTFFRADSGTESRFRDDVQRIADRSESESVRAACESVISNMARAFAAPSAGAKAGLVDALLALTIEFEKTHRDALDASERGKPTW